LSEPGHAVPLEDVAGWTVSGRHGPLGRVVQPESADWDADEHPLLLVRGGRSRALLFHVPLELVTVVARSRCEIRIDADVSDFSAHLRADGSVDLFPIHPSAEPQDHHGVGTRVGESGHKADRPQTASGAPWIARA
jgi:hypothetical protein